MAALASVATAGASTVASSSSSSSPSTPLRRPHARAVSFRVVSRPKIRLGSSKVSQLNFGTRRSSVLVANSQPNEVDASHNHLRPVTVAASVAVSLFVALYHVIYLLCSKVVGGTSNDSAAAGRKPDVPAPPGGDATELLAKEEVPSAPMSPEGVSEFVARVASLVKLVDSRDIIELQLKQQDCELTIRKKDALPQPPPAPVVMMLPHGMPPVVQPQPVPPPPAAPPPAGPAAQPAPPSPHASAAKSTKSSLPPLKSPMAGTFYRNPGPGQPPFVKVGDKVNKGQVLCIIEAMKLMNEIESDHGGTVIEILVDDGKPVSIDQPLFVIGP